MIFLLFGFFIVTYIFILYVIKRDKGSKEPLSMLFAAAGFGLLALVLAGFLNNLLLPAAFMDNIKSGGMIALPLTTIAISGLLVGLVEESLKSLPLAFFIYKKGYFNEVTDGVIYFGISGLTFGAIETLFYALDHGSGVGLYRLITMPYLHATLCAIFGLILARKKFLSKPWVTVLYGYIFAILTHAFYNIGLGSGYLGLALLSTAIAICTTILLFKWFRAAQKQDEVRGMSTVGINIFCRNCGAKNSRNLLFCERCGKHT